MPSKSVEKLSPEEYRQIISSPIAVPVNQKILAQIKDPDLSPSLVRLILDHPETFSLQKIIS